MFTLGRGNVTTRRTVPHFRKAVADEAGQTPSMQAVVVKAPFPLAQGFLDASTRLAPSTVRKSENAQVLAEVL